MFPNELTSSFTSSLALALTGRSAPSWLNRAAYIGQNLPCLVPQDLQIPTNEEISDAIPIDTPTRSALQPVHIPTLATRENG